MKAVQPGQLICTASHLSDGSEVEVFRYYADELRFSPDELVGRTVEEARKLHTRDSEWLSS